MRTAQRAIRLLSKLTRRLIKQKARHHCRSSSDTLWAYGFRYYFTPLTAVLFTFPSRYLFTIGHWLVFSLMPWSAHVHARFHVYRVTQDFRHVDFNVGYGPLTLSGAVFLKLRLSRPQLYRSYKPRRKTGGLGCSAFARRY
jgi:hypothetical protein